MGAARALRSRTVEAGVDQEVVAVVASALVGLVAGSFANVLVYRLPRHLSVVRPPSHCPACDARLGAAELVPVLSWIALGGRCRHCAAAIPARYPLVELATAALFGAVAGTVGSVWPLPSLLVLAGCTLVAAVIDAEGSGLPGALAAVSGLAALSLFAIGGGLGQVGRDGWGAVGAALAALVMVLVERGVQPDRWRRVALLGALGCAAGWLWAGGGAFVAAWVVVAAAATGSSSGRRPPLALVCAGALVALLASALIARP